MTKSYTKCFVAAIIGMQLVAVSARGDDTAADIAALKKQIEALSARVQQLEGQLHVEMQTQSTNQFTAGASNTACNAASNTTSNPFAEPGFVSAGSNGFWLRSADSNFTLRLQGVGQLDGHYYQSLNPGQKDTLTIRRLRLIESGSVYHDYDYYIQEDFGALNSATTTNNSLLQDAYVNIHFWPEFQILGGKTKELVSLEWQPMDSSLWFVERSYPSELVPNRNIGIQVHGDLFGRALSYAAGMYNGLQDGGSGDIETDSNSKDVAGRIFAQPFTNTSIAALKGLGLGVGTSYGYEVGSSLPSFSTVGRQTFFSYSNNTAVAAVTETGDHVRLVPQGWYFWGPAGLFWEYAYSSEKFQLTKATAPKTTKAFFDNSAWDINASWYLTGEKNNLLSPPSPLHPFKIHGGGLGAWQLMARVSGLNVDPAAFSKKADFATAGSAQNAETWSVGLNWYMNRRIKWIFEYDQTRFGFAPGYKANKGSLEAQDEKVLMTRLQFQF